MGVCRFFQQGSCRFGTKCHNEHFDVKQYLKTDIESCINSNMWRFSVYGPFKDKGNIPNFIEDQSFEEVRFQAYESRRLNCFDQFHQQFTKEVHDTINKMKAMLQMTPQIIDMMIKIYDAPEGSQPATSNNPNPFGFAGNNAAQQVGSIFSKPALGSSGGNIFGGPAATPSFAPAPTANSIFGGASVGGNNAAGNIFGGATNANIFSQPQQQQSQAFGQQQANPFGQQQPLAQAQPSIFAQPQQQQQQLNPFGQPQATSAFSGGGGNIFTQPQTANPSPFGQANAFLPQQQQQQQQQQAGGIFAQAAAAPNPGNIFAQAAQQQQQQPPSGFFGQAAATTGFSQPQQLQMQAEAPQQLQMQQQQQQLQLQQQLQPQQPPNSASSIYSRMEDLSQEEIAAFKAAQFAPGQVPFKPPPRELC
ncbi:nucleoporin-like protein amo1 [Drosophila innubila]|uniref:nucleoporin-like protein amo1 n=1 Tax=Drosophila innubila TaxID=198719 RepID=UPI00148B7564|nr:nucleoporin-like protein amo1 [Drosophila innubila]